MTDYSKLADIAKLKEIVDTSAITEHKKLRAEHCSFFESVILHLKEEMKEANVELHKRRAPIFEQIHLPSFDEEFILTYGTNALCRVGRGIMRGGCRITAIISGPPNGYEISRKEYLCKKEETCHEVITIDESQSKMTCFGPDDVAADIVSSVLVGKFS
ncbi:MAG: hypothetical protein WBQ94_09790 [Terracidiphilus sp.]